MNTAMDVPQVEKTQSVSKKVVESILKNIFKAGITGGILYYLYRKGMLDFSRVHSTLTNGPLVMLCLLLLSGTTFGTVIRWRMLLKGQNIKVSALEAFRLSMIGLF